MESNKQQTPITPESLEGIGFREVRDGLPQLFYFAVAKNKHLSYSKKKFEFEGIKLHFTSIEQIQEWIKPFTKETTVAEEVENAVN